MNYADHFGDSARGTRKQRLAGVTFGRYRMACINRWCSISASGCANIARAAASASSCQLDTALETCCETTPHASLGLIEMNFLAPAAFLFALTNSVVWCLYLLKRKRVGTGFEHAALAEISRETQAERAVPEICGATGC